MLASLSTPTPRLEQSYLYTQSTDSAHLEQDLRNQLEQANYERSMHLHKIEQLELKLRRANQGKHQHDPSSQPTPNQLKLSRRNILLRLERQIQRNQDTNDSLTQEMEQDKKRIQYEHSNLVDTLRDTKQTIQHHEKELMVHKEEHALMKKNTRQRQDSIKQEELRHETLEEKIRQLTATVTKKNQKAKGIQKDLDNEQDVQRAVVTTTKDVQNDTHDLEMSVASIGKKIKHMEEQTMPMAVTKQTTTQRTNEAHLKKIRAKQDDVQRESVLVGERTMVVKEEVRGGRALGTPPFVLFISPTTFFHRQLFVFIANYFFSSPLLFYHQPFIVCTTPNSCQVQHRTILLESKEFEASMHVNTRNDLQEQCRTWATEQEECKDHIAALKAKLFAVTNAEVRQKGKKAKLLQVLARLLC